MKPKVKAIEKVESRPVEDELTLWFVVTSEKDGGREDALETLHDPVVPLAVLEEAEEVEHLGPHHQYLCGCERDEDAPEVNTQWVR